MTKGLLDYYCRNYYVPQRQLELSGFSSDCICAATLHRESEEGPLPFPCRPKAGKTGVETRRKQRLVDCQS